MAFSKTSASSREDMLSQLMAFAISNAGFSDAGSFALGAVTHYRLLKGGLYYYFHVSGTNIAFRMSFTSASAWPGTDTSSRFYSAMSTLAFAGPYPSLYLYTDGNAVALCVELATGIFNHMSFGKIDKTDVLDGGEFTAGGCYTYLPYGMVSVGNGSHPPFMYSDGSAPYLFGDFILQRSVVPTNDYRDFACFGYQDPTSLKKAGGNLTQGINDILLTRTPNTATQRTILFNNYIFLIAPLSGLWQCAGHIPLMRGMSMRNVDPAALLYTDWQCFPIAQQNGSGVNTVNSGNYGIAYKRA